MITAYCLQKNFPVNLKSKKKITTSACKDFQWVFETNAFKLKYLKRCNILCNSVSLTF